MVPEAFPEGGLAVDDDEPRTTYRVEADARANTITPVRASKLLFLFAAGVSFLLSIYLWFLVDREQGLFVGLWVPSILALGALLTNGKEIRDE